MHSGMTRPTGTLSLKHITPRGPGLLWKARNLKHVLKGRALYDVARLLKIPTMYATLELDLIKASGERIRYGVVSTRVVTTAYCTALATLMNAGTLGTFASYKFQATGTGAVAEAIGDTALGADSGVARATGTQSNPTGVTYRVIATQTYASTLAITEHGIFDASTVGTLLDRSVFSAVNVVSGDSIQGTYTLTLTAGG